MELGINVDKNRLQVLNMLQSKQEMGIALTDKETKELAEYNNELKKSKAIPTYVENIKNAKDVNRIQKERLATLKSLKVEEVGLRKEIEKGISTDKNRKRLMEILQQRQDLGVTLSKKARIELKAYNAELQRSKTVGTATDLFSPAWFKHRAKWFMELRGLWAAYRGVGDAIRSTLDYQVQLSRAMRTATSIAMDHTETMQHYGQIMRESISTHAADWKDLGEVLYQLGSAGLSAEESMAGLNTTMSLIVGTEGDARETTKSVAGVYNNFKDTLNKVGGAEEKLTYITDLMAAAWKKHQIEINELTDGYAQASAMAKVAGISIEDLTALLAVANDHMIKGGRAGRALTNVWSRMAKTPRAFGEAFGIDIDPYKPIKFMDIMGKIAGKLGNTEQSVAALGVAFERLGLRGAPIFEVFIQNWEKIIKTQEDFANISGTAAKLEQERLDNLDGQWKRLVGNLKSYAAQTEGLMANLSMSIKFWADNMGRVTRFSNFDKLIENIFGDGNTASIKARSRKLQEFQLEGLRKHRDELIVLKNEYKNSVLGRVLGGDVALQNTIEKINTIMAYSNKILNIRKETKKTNKEIADEQEMSASQVEREFNWLYKGDKSRDSRLKFLIEELKIQKNIVENGRKDAEDNKNKSADRAFAMNEALKSLKKQKQLESEIKKILSEEKQEQIKSLNLKKDFLDADIRTSEAREKELKRLGVTNEEYKELKVLTDSILSSKEAKAKIDYEIDLLNTKETDNEAELVKLAKQKLIISNRNNTKMSWSHKVFI
ncbi:phage tail tape measure protein, partial [Patescibacteria group bacterium]|nr:phage tail tape measure protein [Patescibacteria group bacterium]